MVLKSGTLWEILGTKVHWSTVVVVIDLARFAFFSCNFSCLSIIFWTPSGRSKSAFLLISYSKILYLLSIFFLLILSTKLTSQYQGRGLAINLYYSEEKSQWGSSDLGLIKRSDTLIELNISSLNLYSLYFLYLSSYFSILSYMFYLTNSGTSLTLIGFIASLMRLSRYSIISATLRYLIDVFPFLSFVSKANAIGIVTLNFLFAAKTLLFLFWRSLSFLRLILFCLIALLC